jgi:hypothetical protein
MPRIITRITKINKESLTTKLTLIIIGLTAGSALLVPATYASFHPVTSSEIADNSILSVDIGNGQVTAEDIGQGQVRTGDILDGQVYSVDIRDGQVGSVDIGNGQVTAEDLASGAIQISIVVGEPVDVFAGMSDSQTVDCPSGEILTGGGFSSDGSIRVMSSHPSDENTWFVEGLNVGGTGGTSAPLTPYALCV